MAIAKYINDLLYRYECVILPDFGAFIAHRQPAGFNREISQFFPPQKTVSFNSQLTRNDGLLVNYIMEAEKISYKASIESITAFVEDLQHLLQKEEMVLLSEIGSFKLNSEGKTEFEPVAHKNYLKESFGLSEFPAREILREENRKRVIALEEKAVSSGKRTSRPYLKYAAVGIIALGLSGFAGLNFYSNSITEHNLAEQLEANSQLEDQIQKATFVIESPLPAVTLKVAKQEGNYHIVAGAFRMEENADEKVEQLQKEGFPARKIEENQYGLHPVLFSSHTTKREAINTLWKIKRENNPGAWLLVKEI